LQLAVERLVQALAAVQLVLRFAQLGLALAQLGLDEVAVAATAAGQEEETREKGQEEGRGGAAPPGPPPAPFRVSDIAHPGPRPRPDRQLAGGLGWACAAGSRSRTWSTMPYSTASLADMNLSRSVSFSIFSSV